MVKDKVPYGSVTWTAMEERILWSTVPTLVGEMWALVHMVMMLGSSAFKLVRTN